MAQTRSERVEARTTPEVLEIVRRAASLEGRSVSDFIIAAAETAARKKINDEHVLHLSREDQRQFVDSLLNPVQPTPAMLEAHAHRRRLIG